MENGTAMEELEAKPLSSVLSVSILNKFKKEFEKTGMFQFTPELQGKLTKCLDETFEENHFTITNPTSPTVDIGTAKPLPEQLVQATLSPLVYQFEMPKQGCVYMGMLINGRPEVLKNEEGLERIPALAAFTDDKGLVYGAEASKLLAAAKEKSSNLKAWQCVNLQQPFFTNQQQSQSINLKEMGLLNLPALLFIAFLIRKLKMNAESKFNEGSCGTAIMTVPMRIKCAQRLRLKEAALLAGFKDVYLISAEGLAAYFWFHEKEREIEQNNYSKEFVIVDLFGLAVVYKSSFERGIDGKEVLVVKAIILLDLYNATAKEKDKFSLMIRKTLKIPQNTTLIPVITEKVDSPTTSYLGSKYKTNNAIVKDDEVKFFATKGAALLSEQPENIGLQAQNMIGTTITIEPTQEIILADGDLAVRSTFNIEHQKTKYQVNQIGCGRWREKEMIGYLVVNGVRHDAELEVSYELSWESIWKVVGVSAKNPSEDDSKYEAVNWDWLIGDKMDFASFGGSSYEECKSLLLKLTPRHSEATCKVEIEESAWFAEERFFGDLTNPQDEAIGRGYISGATSNGDQSGIQKRKWETIQPNEMIANVGLKKIKLEIDPKAKTEQGCVEEEEVDVEDGVVKIKLEEIIIVD